METIFVGPEVSSCEPIRIPLFHYAITGQTQLSGKTTAIKTLAKLAVEEYGYKVLVFDTKENEEDYADFGEPVPVCMRETTDSFVLIGLLESMFRRRLTRYYGTLSRLAEGAKSFQGIIARAKELEQTTRSGFLKDAARVLYDLIERLQAETAKVETVQELELPHQINRMILNQFTKEAQQLIVKNAFEDALKRYNRRVIVIIDEAFKFIPQRYSSACTEAIQRVITQGAKTKLYVWIGTQFLAPTDKNPLKACAVRLLGTQDHPTEVKHTLDLIPFKGFTKEDIMRLPLGHFIVVTKKFAKLAYLLPDGVPKEIGRKVAHGKISPEQVRDQFLLRLRKEDEDLVWKEKYEELLPKYNEAQRKLSDLLAEIGKPREYEKKLREENKRLQKTIVQLKDDKARLENRIKFLEIKTDEAMKRIDKDREDLRLFDELQSVLRRMVRPPGFEPGISEVSVEKTIPKVTVNVKAPIITMDESSWQGRLALLIAEGFFNDKRKLGAVQRELERRGYGRGRPATISNELTKLCAMHLLERRQESGSWSYFATRQAKERVKKEADGETKAENES